MTIRDTIRKWLGVDTPVTSSPAAPVERKKISTLAVARAGVNRGIDKPATDLSQVFAGVAPPKGIVPPDAEMAMDYNPAGAEQFWSTAALYPVGYAGIQWLGLPYLAQLSQRTEYRSVVETHAREMTREWIEFRSKSESDDKSDKISRLNDLMEQFKVRDVFCDAFEKDGFFGRAHIYVDLGDYDDYPEQASSLVDKDGKILAAKVPKGGLKGFRIIEPIWTYPGPYNADNPMSPRFYRPDSWYVMGKKVDVSRLILMVTRPVPDTLKPAYQFGGVSLSQLIKEYVDNWLRTRQSVSDMVHSFSVSGLKTVMETDLEEGGDGTEMNKRAEIFTGMRDNMGLMLVDKDSEEFFNVSTPLTTLDALQAQAQEQMASAAQLPLIIWLKITPAGLNASSDGEMEAHRDTVHANQERERPLLQYMIDLIQMSEYGMVDDDIVFEFRDLKQMTQLEESTIRKNDADAACEYIDRGVIDAEEERQRLATSETSAYSGLVVSDVPEPPDTGGAQGFDGEEKSDAGARKA